MFGKILSTLKFHNSFTYIKIKIIINLYIIIPDVFYVKLSSQHHMKRN